MEQHDTVLQSPEDGKREGNVGNREVFDQQNTLEASEIFGMTRGKEAPTSSGLRRRFVSVAGEPVDTPSTAMSSGSASSDDSLRGFYGRESVNEVRHFGSVSRKILEPDMSNRDQPPKSKKKKKMGKVTSAIAKPVETHRRRDIIRQVLETADENVHTDAYPLFVIRDFVLYLIFMILICFIALGSRGSAYNYYSDVLRGIVTNSYYNSSLGPKISFRQTKHYLDMWSFIINVVCKVIYDKNSESQDIVNRELKILTENILFGVPQLRQLRVQEKTCSPAPFFETLYENCADYYSEDIEDRNDFGPRTLSWRYVPSNEERSYFTGKLSNYPRGGFVMNFTNDENFTKESIEELHEGSWVGFGTRAIFLDFVLFNPNTHLFCVCKLVFEFPPYGGIIPSSRFWTLKLIRYIGAWDYFILGCEIIFVCFTVYYTFEEAIQMFRLRGTYWSNWWNMLDLAIVTFSYYAIICGLVSAFETGSFVERNVDSIHTNNHVSFDRVVDIQSQFDISIEIVLFIVWLKIFKFSTLNKTALLVSSTVANTGAEIIIVSLMMLSIVVGFTLFGFTLFGSLVHSFRTVGVSLFTMLRLFTGGIHWHDDLTRHGLTNSWMLVYCIIFFLFARVLFLNVLVAILVNGFEEELRDYNEISNTATIGDVFREWVCWLLMLIGRDQTAINIYDKEIVKQYKRIYEALVKILRRHGYEGVEADLMMEKHQISYGVRISKGSMTALYEDIHVRNQLYLEVEEHNKLNEQIEQIDKTVLVIDQTLMGLMTKVDMLTNRYIQKKATLPPS